MSLTEHDLRQFSGGDVVYSHWTKRMIYTEGIQYLAEKGGAFWLIDAIASYQGSKKLRSDPMLRDFQIWELKVSSVNGGSKSAVLTCKADDGIKPIIRQKIEYTDFPLPEIKLYVERGEQLTLMLPSER